MTPEEAQLVGDFRDATRNGLLTFQDMVQLTNRAEKVWGPGAALIIGTLLEAANARREAITDSTIKEILKKQDQIESLRIEAGDQVVDVHYGASQKPHKKRSKTMSKDAKCAYIFGTVFVLLVVALAVWIPNPTAHQELVFRICLAVAAAGVGAVIPGTLNVKTKWIRASGAVGLFVVIYSFNPAHVIATTQASAASAPSVPE